MAAEKEQRENKLEKSEATEPEKYKKQESGGLGLQRECGSVELINSQEEELNKKGNRE